MQEKKYFSRPNLFCDIASNLSLPASHILAEPNADFVAVCTTGSLFYRNYRRELADKRDS